MATTHDVTFRADGPVTSKFHTNDAGKSCLTITSQRQTLRVSLTAEQADEVRHSGVGMPHSPEPVAPATTPKKTTSPKKTTKKKKKTTKTKKAKKSKKKDT